jgi:hypothetical protein
MGPGRIDDRWPASSCWKRRRAARYCDPGPVDIEAEAAKLRQELIDAAREFGLPAIRVESDDEGANAVNQAVQEVLGQIAQNQRQAVSPGATLERVAGALRFESATTDGPGRQAVG